MNDVQTLLQILARTPDIEKKLENITWTIKAEDISYSSYDKVLTIRLDDITALEFHNKKKDKQNAQE